MYSLFCIFRSYSCEQTMKTLIRRRYAASELGLNCLYMSPKRISGLKRGGNNENRRAAAHGSLPIHLKKKSLIRSK